jgi:hypothetical protein
MASVTTNVWLFTDALVFQRSRDVQCFEVFLDLVQGVSGPLERGPQCAKVCS